MIYPETLTTGELTAEGDHSETAKINGQAVTITLKKA
jgi:hypothetical protein